MTPAQIQVLRERIEPQLLARLVHETFSIMVKYVVDLEGGVIAIGGELHADAEAVLLESGASPAALWGANYYPGRGKDSCIEFTALINIRPARGNPGMEVMDQAIRARIQELTFALIGEGEPLP